MFAAITDYGVTRRAFENNICKLMTINPRDFTTDSYHRIDDKAYGGGAGMVMKAEPLELALQFGLTQQAKLGIVSPLKIYLSPQGKPLNQDMVNRLAKCEGMVLVCGRYEGIDERFIKRNIDMEISIADTVVSGGELPAMFLIDSIMRQLPGVLNDGESAVNDSFMNGLLDYPHYTTPRNYMGMEVPEVLLSGNHEQIKKWRLQMSLLRTSQQRPDLLKRQNLTKIESRLLEEAIASVNNE